MHTTVVLKKKLPLNTNCQKEALGEKYSSHKQLLLAFILLYYIDDQKRWPHSLKNLQHEIFPLQEKMHA